MFSLYDFLPFLPTQVSAPSNGGRGVLLAARFHAGERSEREWNRAARCCRQNASPALSAPAAGLPSFGYCVPLDLLLFLRRQEHEAAALAQRATGGGPEPVQPSDGLEPVRSPARAAHARCSKLERLPERRPGPSARISKDEQEHDQNYGIQNRSRLRRRGCRQSHPATSFAGSTKCIQQYPAMPAPISSSTE